MKKRLILFAVLSIIVVTAIGQTTQIEYKEKYFQYITNNKVKSLLAIPMFSIDCKDKKDAVYFETYTKTDDFPRKFSKKIMSILKKYYKTEELREMTQKGTKAAAVRVYFQFDYYGNIKYVYFIFEKRLKELLTDEKLYALYQDFSNLKYDTSTLDGWGRVEPQDKKKAYTMQVFYIFNKWTYPED